MKWKLIPRRAIITTAGLGTRLLPMTKELPKEMLPIYVRGVAGDVILKPLLQALFKQLYRFGIREYSFVVGCGKRAVQDHLHEFPFDLTFDNLRPNQDHMAD